MPLFCFFVTNYGTMYNNYSKVYSFTYSCQELTEEFVIKGLLVLFASFAKR